MHVVRFRKRPKVAFASVIGPSHLKSGLPNQDSYACYHSDEFLAMAVADGLGSAPHSEIGASFATHLAVQHLSAYLYNYGKPDAKIKDATTLRRRILDAWTNRFQPNQNKYDTTLLFVGWRPDVCIIGQIGDGLILYRRIPEGEFAAFQEPTKQYLNDLGCSMARSDAIGLLQVKEYEISTLEDYDSFVLMTDGVADDLIDAPRYSNELLGGLCEPPTECWNDKLNKHLAEWPTPGHYDDKTLLVATTVHQSRGNKVADVDPPKTGPTRDRSNSTEGSPSSQALPPREDIA